MSSESRDVSTSGKLPGGKATRFVTVTGLFVGLLLTGGVWIALTELIPAGTPRDAATAGLGLVFVGLFLWLLVDRVRALYSAEGFRWRDLAMLAVNLLLMLAAYAWIYTVTGVTDTTQDGNPTIGGQGEAWSLTTYLRCFYFSVATLTTVGYGDFRPTPGIGRWIAASQALLGYIVLGVLASTAADIISSVSKDGAEPSTGTEEDPKAQD
jgi:hypothetical protein